MIELRCKICGMIINDKNFMFNKNGIPKENTLENLKYCPFCGAKYEFLEENNDKIIKEDNELMDKDTIKILDSAMKLEIFNGDFYLQASKLVNSVEVKKFFEDLSKIEIMHARVHQRLGGFPNLPNLIKLDYRKYIKDDPDKDMIEEARKRELHASKYYKNHAKNINHKIVTEIFNVLSEIESDHVRMEERYL
ncbi:metal-iron-binding protein [Haloimpatiens sp. FM7315]|uniref:metal-iron-binding protein n=1 Tax=Haloimpatiens sp. FM7315 TaxID=3298609 RepID=UPI00370BDC71